MAPPKIPLPPPLVLALGLTATTGCGPCLSVVAPCLSEEVLVDPKPEDPVTDPVPNCLEAVPDPDAPPPIGACLKVAVEPCLGPTVIELGPCLSEVALPPKDAVPAEETETDKDKKDKDEEEADELKDGRKGEDDEARLIREVLDRGVLPEDVAERIQEA